MHQMGIIITYDVPSKHVELKKEMFSRGYKDRISEDSGTIYLPNTTLYHPGKTSSQARDEMILISKNIGINLERCVATNWESWAAIWGEPFK
jgi:hypothetical protein